MPTVSISGFKPLRAVMEPAARAVLALVSAAAAAPRLVVQDALLEPYPAEMSI